MSKNYQAIVWQISIAALVVICFGWISVWDIYSLQVIPLQTKYNLGFAKESDLKELAQICYERKRYACASSTLKGLISTFQSSRDPASYQKLIDSYLKLDQLKQALQAIESLEKTTGITGAMLEQKATIQIKLGEEQKAVATFDKAAALSKGADRISIVRDQIALMIKLNLFQQAQNKILEVRRSSTLAGLFMEKELRAILNHASVAQLKSTIKANAFKTN